MTVNIINSLALPTGIAEALLSFLLILGLFTRVGALGLFGNRACFPLVG